MALVRQNRSGLNPIQRWDLGNFGDVFSDFDRLFGQAMNPGISQLSNNYPVDLYETEGDMVLEMAVPGVRVDDLDISIEGRQLTVRGNLNDVQGEGRRYWLQSIPRGQFTRSVTLPSTVEVDNIQARVTDGLLVLTMPKVAEARARKIAINNG